MREHHPSLILVCGAPASGKTTLARRLATDLRCPLLEKDTIKESLAESLGAIDLDASRRIGAASFELLYSLAGAMLARGVGIMIEANLTRPHADAALTRLAECGRILIVQCEADPDTIARRYRERSEGGERHASHFDLDRLPALRDGLARGVYDLTGLGHGAVAVRTDDGYRPGYVEILARIRAAYTSAIDRTPSPGGTPAMTARTDTDIANRIDALLAEMTPAEKAGQLTQYFYFGFLRDAEVTPDDDIHIGNQPVAVEEAMSRGEVGSLLFQTDPAEINRLQKLAIEGNRHGIPLLFGFDVIHGLRTIFPVPLGMAATWDPDTIAAGQAVAAREARAVGIHWAFAPMVDIARDPRWGRMIEGAGEDPYLGAAVAVAQVRGFQGEGIGSPERIIAGPKHFAGYGAALGGRDYDEANISDYELWNIYLPPFKAAVDAGAGNIMTAYMDLNGIPATGNRWLFTDVLRDTWGFDGFVVSDANAVKNLETHGFARDQEDSAARALDAGCDMEMAIADPAFAHLPDALADGAVDESTLDAAVRRVLEAKFRMGLFDYPYVDVKQAGEVLADPAHREAARIAAERSAVLLKNDGLLPLDAEALKRIAVIGPLADSKRDTIGPWCFDFDLDETTTVLQGLRDRAGDGVTVDHAPGIRPAQRTYPSMFDMWQGNAPEDPEDFDDEAELARAVDLARGADIAVVVVGEWQNMIGENASRASLDLPGRQFELIQSVADTGTPVVLLVMNGRPLDLRWAAEHVPAILDIWYPGTRGGEAVANLLFGDVAPGGKLPFTWPRSVGQVPMIYNHTVSHDPEKQDRRYWDEESTPLFPFGHGLTYGATEFRKLALDREQIAPGESLTVTVEVANTGDRPAEEVAQLYIHQRFGRSSRPVRELKGFERIALMPGETRVVELTLGPAELRYWNAAVQDWVQDAAIFDIWVGSDSTAQLHATFEVTG